MKFLFLSVLYLVVALFVHTSALPAISKSDKNHSDKPMLNTQSLTERAVRYPVKTNDFLVAQVMANLKANLHSNIFASISANFYEKAAASLKIHANILGGLVKVEDVHVKAIESAAVNNFRTTFDAKLNAKIQAHIYDRLEVSLRKSCGVYRVLDELKLLEIIADLESVAKALIIVELPKIGAELNTKIREELEIAIKGVEVNIPLILQIAIDVGINEKATLEACIDAALKVCTKLDARASARAILEAL
ncbi:hypothetical protein [Parasitella parasitica]|uniref:Uncharacterized protein n=1 Tax=Parasitella parasitica TaxID=35722 RepID=A0A0B7NAW8_9FUNG|nr:hypothetical protein [Parasitella parasitica]